MNRPIGKRVLAGAFTTLAIISLTLASGVAAQAGTTWYSANGTIKPQGTHLSGAEVKSSSSANGQFNPTAIGANRTIGAIMATDSGADAPGTVARNDIQQGETVNLVNGVKAGTRVHVKYWGNPFWNDDTFVTAKWRSN